MRGVVVVPVAWIGFTAAYTGRGRLAHGRNPALLFIVRVLALFTTGIHRPFWSDRELDTSGPFIGFVVEYGPHFWVWISYAYALLPAAAPWVGKVMHILDLGPTPNSTPFSFLLTGAIAFGISRFGLLDAVPVARGRSGSSSLGAVRGKAVRPCPGRRPPRIMSPGSGSEIPGA